MMPKSLIFTAGFCTIAVTTVTAFSPAVSRTAAPSRHRSHGGSGTALAQYGGMGGGQAGLANVADEMAQRDVYAMEEWATQYGVQKAPGVELYTEDGSDYSLVSQAQIAAGTSVLYVPAEVCLSATAAVDEFGDMLQQSEQVLVQIDQGTQQRLPLFRLMVKILAEYDKGQDSPWYPWLNALPRIFYNGVSMTDACYACLPPYAGWLASSERINYSHFVNALRMGYAPLSPETVNNDQIVKWAYNVALTRFDEVWEPQRNKLIAPMADMLNHSAEPNCEVTYDMQGNCNVMAIYDIQPGTPLTSTLGDPSNPTPIFAQYGFLPNDCATIFCKAMHLEPTIKYLGYDFKDLLFQTESGEIAPKVWDIFLYQILEQNDQGAADNFYVACKTNDEAAKQEVHGQYYEYTLEALRNHVYSILGDVETLTANAQSYDLQTHPRVPVIVAHNSLVQQTFTMTAALLEQMG